MLEPVRASCRPSTLVAGAAAGAGFGAGRLISTPCTTGGAGGTVVVGGTVVLVGGIVVVGVCSTTIGVTQAPTQPGLLPPDLV